MRRKLIITGVIITLLTWPLFGWCYYCQHEELQKADRLMKFARSEAGKRDIVPQLEEVTKSLKKARCSFERIGTSQEEFNELQKENIKNNKKFSEDLLTLTSDL